MAKLDGFGVSWLLGKIKETFTTKDEFNEARETFTTKDEFNEAWDSISQVVTETTLTEGGTAVAWRTAHIGKVHVSQGTIGSLSASDFTALSGTVEMAITMPTAITDLTGYSISGCFYAASARNNRAAYGGLRVSGTTLGIKNVTSVAPNQTTPGWILIVHIGT